MTDKVKAALMGDRKAQAELTAAGELLPCPFCGNKAYLFANESGVMVICPECRARSKNLIDYMGEKAPISNSVKSVTKAWNRRVTWND